MLTGIPYGTSFRLSRDALVFNQTFTNDQTKNINDKDTKIKFPPQPHEKNTRTKRRPLSLSLKISFLPAQAMP